MIESRFIPNQSSPGVIKSISGVNTITGGLQSWDTKSYSTAKADAAEKAKNPNAPVYKDKFTFEGFSGVEVTNDASLIVEGVGNVIGSEDYAKKSPENEALIYPQKYGSMRITATGEQGNTILGKPNSKTEDATVGLGQPSTITVVDTTAVTIEAKKGKNKITGDILVGGAGDHGVTGDATLTINGLNNELDRVFVKSTKQEDHPIFSLTAEDKNKVNNINAFDGGKVTIEADKNSISTISSKYEKAQDNRAPNADNNTDVLVKGAENTINNIQADNTGYVYLSATQSNTVTGGNVSISNNGNVNLSISGDSKDAKNKIDSTVNVTSGTLGLNAGTSGSNEANNITVDGASAQLNMQAAGGDNKLGTVTIQQGGAAQLNGKTNTFTGEAKATGELSSINATATEKNIVSEGAIVDAASPKATVTLSGPSNEVNGSLKTEAGVIAVTASTGNNTFGDKAQVQAAGGTVSVKAVQGSNTGAGSFTANQGNINITAKENNSLKSLNALNSGHISVIGKGNTLTGDVESSSNGAVNLEATSGSNSLVNVKANANGNVSATASGENIASGNITAEGNGAQINLNAPSNELGNVSALQKGVVNATVT